VGFNGDGSVEYRFTEKYESEGMSKVTLRYNGSGDLEEKVVSTYLESGLLAGEARLTGDGNISSKKKYSYEFDEKGNWTKQTSTQLATNAPGASPEPSHITRRAIKYY
jgi:hypothetical protein